MLFLPQSYKPVFSLQEFCNFDCFSPKLLSITIMENVENVYFTQNPNELLLQFIPEYEKNKVFILVDENTREHCLPKLQALSGESCNIIEIKSGESHKNFDTLQFIWRQLSALGANRKSLFINLGGGVIGDMGGMAASLYKRGMTFINIPTTLLAQVDASVGGKLAVDFDGLKNEIGLFRNPEKVLICTDFLKTLDIRELVSGYVEMIKHAVIHDSTHWNNIKKFSPYNIQWDLMLHNIQHSVKIKQYFVTKDPQEKNIRKALNFGHTIGHAIESYSFSTSTPLLHGEAVAIGIVCELYLSNIKNGFPLKDMLEIIEVINQHFHVFEYGYKDYDKIIELMSHDKKNEADRINFTLLSKIGKFDIDQFCSKSEIYESLSFYKQINK
jgi:3-dehydroquinate synthase